MTSPTGEQAIEAAVHHKNALLKFISANDAGVTGSHQCGFYLPKALWKMYTFRPPVAGTVEKHWVNVTWQDGRTTKSVVTWYGRGTRSEYRLTRFGRDFPFLNEDTVGDLLVLIPKTKTEFLAFVLDLEEDMEDLQATLGVEVIGTWGAYREGHEEYKLETEDECIDRNFREFAAAVERFPSGTRLSDGARRALEDCIRDFARLPSDDRLVRCVEAEYRLFRLVERRLCESEIIRLFKSVDDFLATASTIMQRRKSRAGRSLENHVEHILRGCSIPLEVRPKIDGNPDIVIPSKAAYDNGNYPTRKLFIVGVKTTCKDRWRQVLNEGKRVRKKYILTTQRGITKGQLDQMHKAGVTLVVPKGLQREYPTGHEIEMLTIEEFAGMVRERLR
ncbi:MAG: hypothetical protein HZC42_08580 [Candidatus Eisenbacteria bacterium]|nr:hypothetical protein [Candidatus Eisenbacteria bacterium]